MLRAGVAIRDITPEYRLRTGGYPDPENRSAWMAHDPLYASAYYFENEKEKMIFIASDIISLSKDRADEIRMIIEKHTGIARENIAVSCTHTHSGPITAGNEWEGFDELAEVNPENTDRVRDKMVEAAKEAVATAFDAKVGWGKGICGKEEGIGGNRHDPQNGPCDPSVNVLAIKDMNDELRGCMVNYSLHPTVLHAENFFYTADYPCYIRQTLNAEYPFMIFGFQLGSSGDQSSRFFRQGQDYREAERIGNTIGKTALEVIQKIEYVAEVELKSASVMVMPPLKDFPPHSEAAKILAESKKKYDSLVEANAPYSEIRAAQSIMEGSIFMEGFTASLGNATLEGLMKRQLPIECHAMRIGECCIVGMGCEHFVMIGKAVKEASPFEVTMISSVTNGNTQGYVCTDEAYTRFCYEAQCSTFAQGAEKALVEGAVQAVSMVK